MSSTKKQRKLCKRVVYEKTQMNYSCIHMNEKHELKMYKKILICDNMPQYSCAQYILVLNGKQ